MDFKCVVVDIVMFSVKRHLTFMEVDSLDQFSDIRIFRLQDRRLHFAVSLYHDTLHYFV